ncbi:MAG: hypothetical protein R3E98_00785 [Gemmatimonadota bacterium]|nr:hypothetical protein [Gemmatimonadota bacterium]
MTGRILPVLMWAAFALGSAPAVAGQVVRDAQVDPFATIAKERAADAAARADIRALLARPELAEPARSLGVNLEDVRARVELLEGEPLVAAHTQATALDDVLDQDRTTISFRTTTLIILLLLVIILILLV